MEYTIDSSPGAVNFAPSPVEEVLQNVKFILLTIIGSVPLDRTFGISGRAVDMPTEAAKATMTAEIFRTIHKYEPRATVRQVAYRNPQSEYQGKLLAEVKIDVQL